MTDEDREETTRALYCSIRQHSALDQWQARTLAEHLIDTGWRLPAEGDWDGTGVVRLAVNLAPDVATVFRGWFRRKRISATEATRRAIATWNFVETEIDIGNTIAVLETRPGGDGRIRKVVMVDAGPEAQS